MKKNILVIVAAVAIGATGTYMALEKKTQARLMNVESKMASIKDELFGYTKYTDYIAAGKQLLTEQEKFGSIEI